VSSVALELIFLKQTARDKITNCPTLDQKHKSLVITISLPAGQQLGHDLIILVQLLNLVVTTASH